MEDIPRATAQAPFPRARRFEAPLCWIFFAIGAVPLVLIVAILISTMIDGSIANSEAWEFVSGIRMVALLVWPLTWGFAIAGFVTALERISEIRWYNRENDAWERGAVSSVLCATLSAIEVAAPLVLTGLFFTATAWLSAL